MPESPEMNESEEKILPPLPAEASKSKIYIKAVYESSKRIAEISKSKAKVSLFLIGLNSLN